MRDAQNVTVMTSGLTIAWELADAGIGIGNTYRDGLLETGIELLIAD